MSRLTHVAAPTASERHFELASLEKHPGWELFCARFHEKVVGQVETQALDPLTPAEETEILKRARRFLINEFTPAKILASMIVQARTEKQREDKEMAQ